MQRVFAFRLLQPSEQFAALVSFAALGEHGFGAAEGWFGTHHPLRFAERRKPCRKVVLSRFSSGLFRAMFAMKKIENGKEIHRRFSA
jgi:hypothetical protein